MNFALQKITTSGYDEAVSLLTSARSGSAIAILKFPLLHGIINAAVIFLGTRTQECMTQFSLHTRPDWNGSQAEWLSSSRLYNRYSTWNIRIAEEYSSNASSATAYTSSASMIICSRYEFFITDPNAILLFCFLPVFLYDAISVYTIYG
jgi:hypothetical protein